MSYAQFFAIIALCTASFIILDGLLGIWIKDEQQKEIDAWDESRRTLARLGENEQEQSSSRPNDLTGARSAAGRQPSRTLRGDISRVWELCKRITKTRS